MAGFFLFRDKHHDLQKQTAAVCARIFEKERISMVIKNNKIHAWKGAMPC